MWTSTPATLKPCASSAPLTATALACTNGVFVLGLPDNPDEEAQYAAYSAIAVRAEG
jgi:hypothetical protein